MFGIVETSAPSCWLRHLMIILAPRSVQMWTLAPTKMRCRAEVNPRRTSFTRFQESFVLKAWFKTCSSSLPILPISYVDRSRAAILSHLWTPYHMVHMKNMAQEAICTVILIQLYLKENCIRSTVYILTRCQYKISLQLVN